MECPAWRSYRQIGSLYVALLALLIVPAAFAVPTIVLSGQWNLGIGPADLVGPPGSPLNDTYASQSDEALVEVTGTTGSWSVSVSRNNDYWPADVRLWVRRTSDGSPLGAGSIFGGGAYQEVTAEPTVLFEGEGDFSDIALQYQVSGVSVALHVDLYDTSVSFTLSDQG